MNFKTLTLSKFIIFSFLVLGITPIQTIYSVEASTYYNPPSSQRLSIRDRILKRFKENNYTPSKYKKTNTLNKNNLYQPRKKTSFFSKRLKLNNYRNNFSSQFYQPQKEQKKSQIIANVRPIRLPANQNNLANNTLDVFNVGVRFQNNSSGFSPAAKIDKIQFEIQNNRGGLTDFRNLSLIVEGEEVDFNQNGFLTIQIQNLRLARNESKNLQIKLRVNDKNAVSQLQGNFRLKLKKITAFDELEFNQIPVSISGQTVSEYIFWSPSFTSTSSDLGIANFSSQTIYGRNLSGGEEAFVLGLRLNASFEDLLLKKITVRNSFGSSADNLISQINLIDINSKQILGQRKMINGKAVFDLRRNVSVARNNFIQLGFQVIVKEGSNINVSDNRLKLVINNSDIEIYGYGSGREIPDSRKNISLDAQIFTLSQGGSLTAKFSTTQPSNFSTTGNLNDMIHFELKNNSKSQTSLGRISFNIFLNGIAFTGGLDLNDARIREVHNGRLVNNSLFNLVSASGNTLTFDTLNEIYLNPNTTRTFGLELSLTNLSGDDSNDSVNAQILGDSNPFQGTLSQARTNGSLFIWSDHSGRPHIPGASDWFSGYLLDGIPSSNIVNYRDKN